MARKVPTLPGQASPKALGMNSKNPMPQAKAATGMASKPAAPKAAGMAKAATGMARRPAAPKAAGMARRPAAPKAATGMARANPSARIKAPKVRMAKGGMAKKKK
jgi:hypothetical protein